MSRLIAFGWYGGKYSHLDWLLPLLPKTTHFCEPFGGSASVLINREPSPVETYNALDDELRKGLELVLTVCEPAHARRDRHRRHYAIESNTNK